MDENYLLAAARYVEIPVRAGMVHAPEDFPWSSAQAHLEGRDDQLAKVAPLLEMVGDWRVFLDSGGEIDKERLRQHERTGRPLGRKSFVEGLEVDLKRILRPRKPGPKKRRK